MRDRLLSAVFWRVKETSLVMFSQVHNYYRGVEVLSGGDISCEATCQQLFLCGEYATRVELTVTICLPSMCNEVIFRLLSFKTLSETVTNKCCI